MSDYHNTENTTNRNKVQYLLIQMSHIHIFKKEKERERMESKIRVLSHGRVYLPRPSQCFSELVMVRIIQSNRHILSFMLLVHCARKWTIHSIKLCFSCCCCFFVGLFFFFFGGETNTLSYSQGLKTNSVT